MAYKISKQTENCFKVFIYVDDSKGYPRVISDAAYAEIENKDSIKREWVEWKKLSWSAENDMRRSCVNRNSRDGTSYIDLIKYREQKFKKLFQNWSLQLVDEADQPITLKFSNGELDEKYFQMIISEPMLKDFLEIALIKGDMVWELSAEPEEDDKGNFTELKEAENSMKSENGQA